MLQSFAVKSDPSHGAERVARLREQMRRHGLDAYLVPHADKYLSEYPPASAERLAWLTGFTGSAGAALVTMDEALIFVDGRYTLQVREQADMDLFAALDLVKVGPAGWLAENARKSWKIGLDPWLHGIAEEARLRDAAAKRGATIAMVDENLIDAIWSDRPADPASPVNIHPLEHAGKVPKSKLAAIARAVRAAGAQAIVVTEPAALCWTFNIRGSDVSHAPLVLGYAIIPARGKPQVFLDESRLGVEENAYLTQLCDLAPPGKFEDALRLAAKQDKPVMLNRAQTPRRMAFIVEEAGGRVIFGDDPVVAMRAAKNTAEKRGARNAHLRDGAAMVTFLAWLDEHSAGGIDEITVATQLERTRVETGQRLGMPLRDIAFDTISGSGPNGAIVHYRVDEKSNRKIEPGDLILVDSGGQYDDGTTDITRVIPAGGITHEEARHRFTLVLKGMIAISLARFPEGTRGMDIDALARNALWNAGFDYAHGTGHGVGSYLNVHEGPQNISRRGHAALVPGMIVSNEPGYYKQGHYGIRIENLVLVKPAKLPKGGDLPMLGFETLTWCPIDRRLINKKLLTPAERRWVNRYHATVRRKIEPLIDDSAVNSWLVQATARL